MTTQSERTATFHRLHATGCFVIPNPWDVGSARVLESMGFQALATTSSGSAWAAGGRDGDIPYEGALAHAGVISAAVDIPVSVDFQDCFASDADEVHAHVLGAVGTGVAGLSIEDSPRERTADAPLLPFEEAVARVGAARAAIDESRTNVLLTARSEGFIVGRPDLAETIRRLVAFSEAGADCLYAPGLRKLDDIRAVVDAVAPKPVNVLVGAPFSTVTELAALGVRRISVGGALARAAWTGFLAAADEIAAEGTFTALGSAIPFPDLEKRLTP
jgi:2-methylisocitrate lyase-like PEP mutase family enzyme